MRVEPLEIDGLALIHLDVHRDERGWWSDVYRSDVFAAHGLIDHWAQDSHSRSVAAGTVRGLHYQDPPHAQAKLVRVPRGSVLDVAVDLRTDSPTFGRHAAVELALGVAFYIPEGFAHGFCSLEDDTDVVYKMSTVYAPESYRGIAWDDPDLGIQWPVQADAAIVSEADAARPRLRDADLRF